MRKYKLLNDKDFIPNNEYAAIVCYPYTSPNRNRMTEFVYYNEYGQWWGTDKEIDEVIDESVISVLIENNPKRALEVINGGYIEDDRYTELVKRYDFKLSEKLDKIQER